MVLKKKLAIFFSFFICISLSGARYYISPEGNDINPGTINKPFYTLNKAWSVFTTGDTIYLRGGTYHYTKTQELGNKYGTLLHPLVVMAYPGENPIIDLSSSSDVFSGISIKDCAYLKMKKIRITNLPQPKQPESGIYGLILWENVKNCTFELIETDHIGGWGVVIGDHSKNILFLNCDSHHNADPESKDKYGGSDGFESGSINSTNITFRGCRSWSNSDDGFDLRKASGVYVIENCWSFRNGYIPDTWEEGGDGDGYKLGGKTKPPAKDIIRKIINSLAYKNRGTGITPEPDNADEILGVLMYNCTAYDNCSGWGNGINTGGYNNYTVVKNCLDFKNNGKTPWLQSAAPHDHNNFDIPLEITDKDFLSTDPAGIDGARKPNGNLPDLKFLHLAKGSSLVDAGVNVGLPYKGKAPDIGAFESNK